MKKAIVFEAPREGYGIDQLRNPMTVGELKELLEDYEDDMLVILSHDRGYTYGSLGWGYNHECSYFVEREDGEWEKDEERFWGCE